MAFRYIASPIPILGAMLALVMLAAVACGGAEAPAPDDSGASQTGAANTTGTQPQQAASSSPAAQSGQATSAPAAQSERPTPPVQQVGRQQAQSVDATPTPVAAALPTEVVADPITLENLMTVYPDLVYGGILRRGGYYDPAHFDLLQVSSVTNSFKQMMLYNNILRYNPIDAGKTIIPDLATSWEVSEDGKTWTFPIREEVNFHDGTTLTADDVSASWSRVIDPPAGVVSARQGLYSPFGPSIEVIDPLTVAFNFETPPPLKYGLNAFALEWHGVFPKAFLEEHGYDLKVAGQNAPSTGAFRYLEHQQGEVWKNEKFPDYWNEGLPFLDEVWTYPLENSTTVRRPCWPATSITHRLSTRLPTSACRTIPSSWSSPFRLIPTAGSGSTPTGNPGTTSECAEPCGWRSTDCRPTK